MRTFDDFLAIVFDFFVRGVGRADTFEFLGEELFLQLLMSGLFFQQLSAQGIDLHLVIELFLERETPSELSIKREV